jgi:hypothetical protein
MRRLALVLATCFAATAAAGETLKTLTMTRPATGLLSLSVKAGVGDVQIESDAINEIAIRVEVRSKHGLFFVDREARRDAEALQIDARALGDELTLSLGPEHHGDTRWVEHWTVRVPAAFAASVKLGVGEITVLDLGGDVRAEVGVGDVRVEGIYQSFGDVHAACGVGDASLRTPAGREQGEGFIAHTLSAQGPGKASIRVHAGVGDVKIRLR